MTGGCRDSPGHSAHQRGPALETVYWTPSLPARRTCTATSCWLPVTSPSHVELVDCELRAAAHAVTCCTASTPSRALMAEAEFPTAGARCTVLATKMLSRALALPVGDRSGRWCRRHRAPSSPASPDGGSCRAGCWAPLECATPRWSRIWARDHIFKRRRHRGAVRGPALQQVVPRGGPPHVGLLRPRRSPTGGAGTVGLLDGRLGGGRGAGWRRRSADRSPRRRHPPAPCVPTSSTRPAELIALRAALSDVQHSLIQTSLRPTNLSSFDWIRGPCCRSTNRIWGTSPPNCGGRVPHPRF